MSTSATALRRRSTLASVPTTSTSKPGTPRSRISSSVWVTPCIPPSAAEEVGVAEVLVLQQREQLALAQLQLDGLEPGVQQRARVVGSEVGADRALADVALAHHALDHGQHRARIDRLLAVAAAERPDGERHRAVRPLRRAALLAAGGRLAGAHVGEVLVPGVGDRRLGEGASDVDPGVVVRAADPGTAVRLDVDRRRRVELARAGAVARLPDGEEL